MKLRMLGFEGKTNYVDYGDGFREIHPEGWENKECWMTDDSEDSDAKYKRGLLPLRSEIDYKRRQLSKVAQSEFNEIKVIDSKGRVRIRKRRKQSNKASECNEFDIRKVLNLPKNIFGNYFSSIGRQ